MPPPSTPPNQDATDSKPPTDRVRWPGRLTLLLLVAGSTALRLAHLTLKPYWFDECFSVELARLDWDNFVHVLWWREANMTFYYLLLRAWMLFGQSEFFIRSLSVGIAAATIPTVYWIATLLYDRRVALIAAALFTFNAYSVRYAQEVRGYALFALLATMSSGFLIAGLGEPSRRNRLGYVLGSILAVYTHFYALLLLVAHWLVVRFIGTPDSHGVNASGVRMQLWRAWKIIGLGVLPLLIFVAKTGAGPIRWIHRPGVRDLIAFFEQLSGGENVVLLLICVAACVCAALPFEKYLLRRDHDWETWRVQFLLVWLLFPVTITVLLSFARPVFLGRYMIFCLPAFVILAAAGLSRLRPVWLLAPALAGFLLLSLQGVFFVYTHDFDNERDGSGDATAFILDHTQPGDGVIFHIAEARVPYEFFRSERAERYSASPGWNGPLGPDILFPHSGPGLEYRDFKAKLTADLLRAVVPGHPRVWVVLIYNSDDDATTTLLTRTLPQWFSKEQRWQFPRLEVRLYAKDDGRGPS